jgi:hypothetical protein
MMGYMCVVCEGLTKAQLVAKLNLAAEAVVVEMKRATAKVM